MTLTIRIEQDGETKEYQIAGDATLTIKGEAQFNGKSVQITGASQLSIEGLAPWDGIPVVVKIDELNVRRTPDTVQKKVSSFLLGEELTVTGETKENEKYIWRQIVTPVDLAGKWVAEQEVGVDGLYFEPVAEKAEDLSALGAGGGTVETPTADAQTVTGTDSGTEETATGGTQIETPPETPDNEPAALTGRFQLVKKMNADGDSYTALAIDGDATIKLGVNIREFPHFGIAGWKWADPNIRADYCKVAKETGMKWVRFFTPNISYKDIQENLDHIKAVLDIIHEHEMLAIVTLTDSIADVGMYPKDDAEWHAKGTPMGHYHKNYFNTKAYEKYYLPYVKEVVSTFKDHKGVGIWQLMNEPAIYPDPASDDDVAGFAGWVDETSKMIYDMDKVHPIAIGMINASHIKPPHLEQQQFAIDFYSKRKYIHVVTCHSYQNTDNGDSNLSWDLEDDCQADINAAAKTGRAMIWSEFGASHAGNRTMSTERFLNRQLLQNRASAALQWGFMITQNDTGIGDRHFGWSPADINREYKELKTLFASYPAKLANL